MLSALFVVRLDTQAWPAWYRRAVHGEAAATLCVEEADDRRWHNSRRYITGVARVPLYRIPRLPRWSCLDP
jgi:hypothetical protein